MSSETGSFDEEMLKLQALQEELLRLSRAMDDKKLAGLIVTYMLQVNKCLSLLSTSISGIESRIKDLKIGGEESSKTS